jgi:ABC-type transport system involved in multi-copper enzyme maturation permease subunit
MRSEIFSQGTLMLRLVIQISMLLALFVMACCLYIWPEYAPWYISYVLLFNMLVGPVFSAGSVTSERERQTLDLLLVTLVTPWQMLWGKLLSGLRVSSVLTSFLLWPVVLACVMPLPFWSNLPTMGGYLMIVALCCVTTAVTALFCSTIFQKSATSLIATYLIIVVMFMGPVAVTFFAKTFFAGTTEAAVVEKLGALSPFSATFSLPLNVSRDDEPSSAAQMAERLMRRDANRDGKLSASEVPRRFRQDVEGGDANGDGFYDYVELEAVFTTSNIGVFLGFIAWSIVYNGALVLAMMRLFQVRWRVAD